MSNNIEEDKRTLEMIRNVFEHLINYGWIDDIKREINPNNAVQAIENILADRERLEAKANKYDSLVEKIKEKIELHKDYLFNQAVTSNPTLDAHFRETERSIISTLQELLEKGEKE